MREGALGLIVGMSWQECVGSPGNGRFPYPVSNFRGELGVGDIMIRANARLNKDVKPGMFVASSTLCWNRENESSGFAAPARPSRYIFRQKRVKQHWCKQQAKLSLGYPGRGGVRGDAVKTGTGDRVIFYTDGIAEAQSESGEVFGFERLLNLAKVGESLDSDGLLKRIMDDVNNFVGAAPQHDDLTMIVFDGCLRRLTRATTAQAASGLEQREQVHAERGCPVDERDSPDGTRPEREHAEKHPHKKGGNRLWPGLRKVNHHVGNAHHEH